MTADTADFNVDGDNDDLLVAGRKRRHLTNAQKIGVAVVVTVVFLAFIWIDYSLQLKSSSKQPEMAFRPALGNYRGVPIALPEAPEAPAPAPPASTLRQGEMTPADSPLMAFGGNDGAATNVSATTASATAPESNATTARLLAEAGRIVPPISLAADDGGPIGSRLKPTALQASKAGTLPHPDLLITKGTIVPCTLQTAISTDLPGFVKCVLPEAVRGTTGNVVLLDRGTTVVGEIQSGLTQGQRRAFVLWDRAETPNHAVVSLASPSADELGRSGVPGRVNNHFWQRFGGAVMLTMVQGSFQAVSAAAGRSSGGTSVYLNPFQTNGERVADTALQSSINIPPTLEKKQGETISIMVARDLDFSDVYALR